MIRTGRRYAWRGLARPATGALVLLGVLVMHGLGIRHGVHLPGQTGMAAGAPMASQHVVHEGVAADIPVVHDLTAGMHHAAAAPAAVVAVMTAALVTTTDDMAGHAGALCTAVLPVLLALLALLLALATLRRPLCAAPPVRAARRRPVRGRPLTRHTTSLLQLCVSRT